MRKIISVLLLSIVAVGIYLSVSHIPFGAPKTKVGGHYVEQGMEETGAANMVTSVVVIYRGFDTLGEVTVLFIAAVGLAAVLGIAGQQGFPREPASFVLRNACVVIFPLILLCGTYIFAHGHLTPGGGFQGGVVIASAFVLSYLGGRERRISKRLFGSVESLAGLVFVTTGLIGLAVGGYFLSRILPNGRPYSLLSAGIIPIIYIAIGFKVGSELAGIIDNLIEETK